MQLRPKLTKKKIQQLKRIRLFASDVDGVLTDAGMYYSESGEELKKFNTRDGMGVKLLQEGGIKVALITSEKTNIVARRAKKLGITEVHQGIQNKLLLLNKLSRKFDFTLHEVAYIGDDINDLDALLSVGFSCAPFDCIEKVRKVVDYVCNLKGGDGAVREAIDLILDAKRM